MRAFEAYLNGRKLCVAGIPEAGVVTAALTWATGPNPNESEHMDFRVGGLISRTHTFVDWSHRLLKEGDEIRLVVSEKRRVSKPKKARTESETDRKRKKLEYLKRLSKELGYELIKKK